MALFLSWALPAFANQDTVLVFNELHYHPEGEETEWVELVSTFGVDVDISGWELDGAVDFTFPVGTIMPGNGFLVVASDPAGVPGSLGPFEGRLDDDGEELRLLNNSGRTMSVIDYNDRGAWPVAPDGSGVTLAKRHPLALSSSGDSWHWSSEKGGTPGEANFPDGLPEPVFVLNEVVGQDEDDFFVEVLAVTAGALNGHQLTTSGGETYAFEDMAVGEGERVAIDESLLGFENMEQGQRLYLWDGEGRLLDATLLRLRGRSRFPDGGEWMISTGATKGEMNAVTLQDAIVINEIMYHHRPTYEGEGEGVEYRRNPEEWVELTNRSEAPVDLTGWEFDSGIRYEFEEGTVIEPGGFLVVAGDAEALRSKYPDIAIVGDFQGELQNGQDHLILNDAVGNRADEVAYAEGGSWPEYADGGGSSLELRHPNSDNSKAGSWAASDEGSKSAWQTYTYRGEATRPPGTNFPRQWNEFNVGLLDAGEFLLDDVSVVEDPDGSANNLIRNRAFSQSIFGGDGSQNWRFRGNHGGHGKTTVVADPSDAANTVLHVLATGATEHMHNQLETTLSGNETIQVGNTYEVSFRAKWLAGSPQLHTRLYFNYLARKTILEMPTLHGTPGAPNSRLEENPGPAYSGLQHAPAVPGHLEPITISVDAADPDGIATLEILWRDDPGKDFARIAMNRVGDTQRYEGVIPGQRATNLFGAPTEAKLHYYLEGTDAMGNTTQWPAAGAESRCLIPLDDGRQGDTPGHNLRIVMLGPDIEFLHEVTNVMSNHRMLCTLIDREEHVYYNVGVRLKGSQRGRNQAVRVGFSLKMPGDQLFHGVHGTVAVDRSGAGNQFSQKEILVKHAINRLGDIPGMYDDLIYIISPDARHEGSAMFLKARYDDEYLDAQFENGSEGRMFEYELIYYPTSTTGGTEGLKRPEPDSVTGVPHRNLGPDKETYRWHYLLENNRPADDYVRLMDLLDLFGSANADNYVERLWATVDVPQWLRAYAIQNLFGIGDNYANGSQHNMVIYFPPNGKAMYFPWDMDFTFSRGATEGITANGDLNNMLKDPVAFRSYYAQMNEMLETVVNREYMERWTEHYSTFLPRENLNNFAGYIDQRNRTVAGRLRSGFPQVPFEITSNAGEPFEVASSTVTLEGTGWYNIAEVVIAGTTYDLEWIDQDVWQLTLPLDLGENLIQIQALDVLGTTGSIFSPVGNDAITVTNIGSGASANAENLVISEIMYHPAAPSDAEAAAGFTNQDDFEFLELHNVSNGPVDLAGVRFTRGIDFDFEAGTIIPGNGYGLLVSNLEAFQQRYPGVVVIGAYEGQLRNSGETLRLRAVDDQVIEEFSYNDREPWPREADGEGRSLVWKGMLGDDPEEAANWTVSAALHGSPGAGEAAPEPNVGFEEWLASRGGDPLADPDGDGLNLLGEYGLGLDLGAVRPRAAWTGNDAELTYQRRTDGVTIAVEASSDLQTWTPVAEEGTATDLGNGLTQVVVGLTHPYARLRLTP